MRNGFLFSLLVMLVLTFSSVQAARFGGGKSFGFKKPIQYRALSQKPQSAKSQQPATGKTASQKKPGMGGLLGGLLAGGLLAALFFGGAFEGMTLGDWLVLLLIGGALFWFLRRRRASMRPALAGADAAPARQANVQDFKMGSGLADTADEVSVEEKVLPVPPPWFEVDRFEASLVDNFRAVQQAWDAGDAETLRSFCSEACFENIRDEFAPACIRPRSSRWTRR